MEWRIKVKSFVVRSSIQICDSVSKAVRALEVAAHTITLTLSLYLSLCIELEQFGRKSRGLCVYHLKFTGKLTNSPRNYSKMAKCWEGKKYKLEKSENFDDYMKELGK